MALLDQHGNRLYLTPEERKAFLRAASGASREIFTFCTVLHDTGCRISEALALTPKSIDLNNKAIIVETLKKRKRGVYRAVPVPKGTIHTLDMVHALREVQKAKKRKAYRTRLWPWSRTTAFRKVQEIMEHAGIPDGPHKCPKGLRHGYGVHAINCGIPLNVLSKWMGHSSLEVTSIYANALGEEQRSIAARMWA